MARGPLCIPGSLRRSPPRARNPASKRPIGAALPEANVVLPQEGCRITGITSSRRQPLSFFKELSHTEVTRSLLPWPHGPVGKVICSSASFAFPSKPTAHPLPWSPGILVAGDDLVVRDLPVQGTDLLVLDAAMAVGMKLVEVDLASFDPLYTTGKMYYLLLTDPPGRRPMRSSAKPSKVERLILLARSSGLSTPLGNLPDTGYHPTPRPPSAGLPAGWEEAFSLTYLSAKSGNHFGKGGQASYGI
jgi:hypothetical protein